MLEPNDLGHFYPFFDYVIKVEMKHAGFIDSLPLFRNRHPGWNKGSIAYHADDGKVFMGSGVGDPFGPRCNKGDTMGCGVMVGNLVGFL